MKIIKKTLDIGSILQPVYTIRQYKITEKYTNGTGAEILVYQSINNDRTLDTFKNLSTRNMIEEGIKDNKIKFI